MVVKENSSKVPSFDDYPALPRAESQIGGRRTHEVVGVVAAGLPLVSIVTVVRNGAKTLPRALDSVLSQDYPEIEYIIVDGGSTDGTLDLLRANQNRIALDQRGRPWHQRCLQQGYCALPRGDHRVAQQRRLV